MQTASFDAKKLNLVELVMAIDTESMLDKVLGYVHKKMNEAETTRYELTCEEKPAMLCEKTIEAIKETRSGKYAGTLDIADFDSFLKSIDSTE